jgi:hypothetical protein
MNWFAMNHFRDRVLTFDMKLQEYPFPDERYSRRQGSRKPRENFSPVSNKWFTILFGRWRKNQKAYIIYLYFFTFFTLDSRVGFLASYNFRRQISVLFQRSARTDNLKTVMMRFGDSDHNGELDGEEIENFFTYFINLNDSKALRTAQQFIKDGDFNGNGSLDDAGKSMTLRGR